jgi:8-oxo-dGTP pyrophosphatase MutT (NUDIX family)
MAPPRIPDPRAIPVSGTDAHLPAVAGSALSSQALRLRFQGLSQWQPEFAGDGRFFTDRAPAAAAVLVPLVQREDGLHVLLTRRTDHLRDHAGQVSFPGGRTEAFDDGPVATALREAQEEVGLAPARVEVIGQMPTYSTVTSFIVTPVVALVTPPLALQLDSREVAEAFEVPLAFLMDPARHQRHTVEFDGGQRHFLSMPWHGRLADGSMREYFIWGATAAMLRNLYRLLSSSPQG